MRAPHSESKDGHRSLEDQTFINDVSRKFLIFKGMPPGPLSKQFSRYDLGTLSHQASPAGEDFTSCEYTIDPLIGNAIFINDPPRL